MRLENYSSLYYVSNIREIFINMEYVAAAMTTPPPLPPLLVAFGRHRQKYNSFLQLVEFRTFGLFRAFVSE